MKSLDSIVPIHVSLVRAAGGLHRGLFTIAWYSRVFHDADALSYADSTMTSDRR